MRIARIALVLALVVVGVLASIGTVSAQSGTWVSGIQIQNESETDDANITVIFYWAEGTANAGQEALRFTDVIPAGESKTYYIPTNAKTAGLPDNFVGSAVVTADQPVAANLNTQLPSGTGATPDNPNRVGTASGVLDPADTQYFTQVMKAYTGDNWNSYIAIQNTSDTQTSATIRYYKDADGSEIAAASQTVSISPYSTYIFRQSDNANLATNLSASAVVTADQPLAGVANFYAAGTSASNSQFHSYNGFPAGATKVYVARVVRNYYGYNGGLKIQNVGSSATDVTVTYYFPGYAATTQTKTSLQPNAAWSIYLPNVTELDPVVGLNQVTGAAIVQSSGQPIVATANEDNRTLGRGITYNGVPDGDQTTTVILPQIVSRYYGYSGGPQVQNVGSATANVTLTFSAPGTTDLVVNSTINMNESKSWFMPDVLVNNGRDSFKYNGALVVTSDQPIVGIANLSWREDKDPSDNWGPNYGDSYVTYNGINK